MDNRIEPMDFVLEIEKLFKGFVLLEEFMQNEKNFRILGIENINEADKILKIYKKFKSYLLKYLRTHEQEIKEAMMKQELFVITDKNKHKHIKNIICNSFKIILAKSEDLDDKEREKLENYMISMF